MIYLLIAGTYVPICLVAMPLGWGITVIAVVGAMALLGIALKMVAFERCNGSATRCTSSWAGRRRWRHRC